MLVRAWARLSVYACVCKGAGLGLTGPAHAPRLTHAPSRPAPAPQVMRAPSRGGAARPPLARAVEMAVLSAAPHPAIVQSFACFPGMYLQTESENESENGGGLAPEVSLLGGGAGRGGGLCSAAVRALRARPLAADDASDDGCDVVVMEVGG